MRNSNGYGCIYKLSGNRRKPWAVRKTTGWKLEGDRVKQQYEYIGYYETRQEAIYALAEYNNDPFDIHLNKITFKEVYKRWSDQKFSENVSDSVIKGYKAAWNVCKPLADMKFSEVKLDHLQKVVDESGKHTPTLKRVKAMLQGMYEYAIIHEIIPRDRVYVEYLDISKGGNPNSRKRIIFTKDEVNQIWKVQPDYEYISVILMFIYSGVRTNELLDLKKKDVHLSERWFFIEPNKSSVKDSTIPIRKTAAGVRKVPIAKKVMPFFTYWMQKNDCDYLISTTDAKHISYDKYVRSYWKPLMKILDMEKHTPYDTRHTCVSMMTAEKIDERFIQKIVGHSGRNVTEQVYTHLEIEELIQEIDKI